jgi:hypothetical protein
MVKINLKSQTWQTFGNRGSSILSLWDSYYVSVRHYDVIHNFLVVLKNIEFQFKTQKDDFDFT